MNILFCGDKNVCDGIFLSSLSICKNTNEDLTFYILTADIENHPIVIYPEAHVWEYYTDIRPFPDTSFKFPIKFNKPAFAMTVTYKKSKIFKKPVMEVFLDGPFYPNGNTQKEKITSLHSSVYETMKQRSKNSNVNYIRYIKK